ncbi:hypothetical protein [Bradyrhizobium sp. 174]|uniref:hypothetical protein n=1 Tax=Bradyrhizobium sp. 174 TaxID=2782645 RepID=UPI001FFBBC1D|nr:hypothetical protein [Bradyrhizobium sp. 174]MCK1577824.1 hypothetical protein [Bradyrhizobium sp. 174]
MTTIFILQSVHFHVPGNHLSAHAAKASADIEAASLVNAMLEWIELPQDAKPETWEADLLRARKARAEQMACDDPDDLGDDDGDIWITELPLVGGPATSATSTPTLPPPEFTYERWRHGGWYVYPTRWPNGGCGCVSNNYEDKKWRIACDPRPFEEQPTFKTRAEAGLAEWHFVQTLAIPNAGQDDRAQSEGWCLIENGNLLAIEADTEHGVFVRDGVAYNNEAEAYVKQKAAEGSAYHIAALARVGQPG